MYVKKAERSMSGKWPAGAYRIRLVRTSKVGESMKGKPKYEVLWSIVGTDAVIQQVYVDHKAASWAWRDWASTFDQIPESVGREFVALIGITKGADWSTLQQETGRATDRNQLKAIIAEFV